MKSGHIISCKLDFFHTSSILEIVFYSNFLSLTVSYHMFSLENFNIHRLTPIIMKYCHDCLTPIKSDSKEEYCNFCKRDRALKSSSTV